MHQAYEVLKENNVLYILLSHTPFFRSNMTSCTLAVPEVLFPVIWPGTARENIHWDSQSNNGSSSVLLFKHTPEISTRPIDLL